MPKRISKEEFDALFGNKRKRDAGGYEDPSREREEWGTSERWRRGNDKARRQENDVPPELLRREKYANSVIENEGEIAPGFQTDAQKAYIAAELLKAHKAGIVKAQASPPPPADILNAPVSPAAQRVRTEAQLDDSALSDLSTDLRSIFGEVNADFSNVGPDKSDWIRAKKITDNIDSYQHSLNNVSAFGGSSKPYPLSPQDSQFISDFFKKQMIYDDGAGTQVYGREGDADATGQFYDLLYDLEVGSGKNAKTRRQVSDELDAKRFAEEEALFAAEQAAKATPVQKQVTDDIWSDNSPIDPRNVPVTPESVSRTDLWGGGSVPPDQVAPSSRQPYIDPEDLQLAVRMLNEAQGAQSPTGNRMGMKFSPELLAAL
ncbi:hypothetical protein CMK18_00090, partial [Candidatus Poribacteria bacterium]|nr:hypothetical protein [Candidatus Poribacteria bacterium]